MTDATSPLVRRVAILLAVATAAGIAIAAFVLSFSALWDVATRVWPNRHLSWLGPAVVDATILQATVSLLVVAHSAKPGERRYFWSLLVGAAATSIAGNALHAITPPNQPLTPVVAALIACIPPIFLCLSTHSVVVLTRRVARRPAAARGATGTAPEPLAEASNFDEVEDGLPVGNPELVEDITAALVPAATRETVISRARRIREEHGLATGTAKIAAVLMHRATYPEASLRELAAAGNVHHNTAKKILEVDADRGADLTLV
ncbi:DUF2637 domain-containing protein [Skermania sp. ID1734]|nr:DUF2637 domain-containing protein [Skermania sp. ID1734]